MFNSSGRLTKKKKTMVKVNTTDPVFSETLNFEVGGAFDKYSSSHVGMVKHLTFALIC
jgi:hypothetical protein